MNAQIHNIEGAEAATALLRGASAIKTQAISALDAAEFAGLLARAAGCMAVNHNGGDELTEAVAQAAAEAADRAAASLRAVIALVRPGEAMPRSGGDHERAI